MNTVNVTINITLQHIGHADDALGELLDALQAQRADTLLTVAEVEAYRAALTLAHDALIPLLAIDAVIPSHRRQHSDDPQAAAIVELRAAVRLLSMAMNGRRLQEQARTMLLGTRFTVQAIVCELEAGMPDSPFRANDRIALAVA